MPPKLFHAPLLATVLLLTLGQHQQAQAAELTCIPATQLNASAPADMRACCAKEWYTSYTGVNGSTPAGKAHVYCGTPSDRALDYQLASTNTSWYQYCLGGACPLDATRTCCIADVLTGNTTTIETPSSPSSTIVTTPNSVTITVGGSGSPRSPSPSPSPRPAAAGSGLQSQLGVIWAIYMCPHTAPSTALFAYNLTFPTAAPPAAATAKAAPLNLTTAPAATLLAACPSVPEGSAPPAYEASFNFTTSSVDQLYGIAKGKPYMLSFFRKPALGAVKVTLSVRLHDDQPDALIHDRVTLTLDAPTPSVVAAVPSLTKSRRRSLLGEVPFEEPACVEGESAGVGHVGGHRRLHRGSGGGGGGGGGGRGRSRSRTKSYGGLTGRRPFYYNETLNQRELYMGDDFQGVLFSQWYKYRGKGTPYQESTRWGYPDLYNSVYDTPKDEVAFAVPYTYRYNSLVNTSIVNTTYGFYGPSVYRPNTTFQYVSNARWPAPKGAPDCNTCVDRTPCCDSGWTCCDGGSYDSSRSFENIEYIYIPYQINRRATVLSCGLLQDYITTLPIYLPTNNTAIRITIHSIEAQATTAAPACGDTAATLDPRDPPLYLSVVRADRVDFQVYTGKRRSSGVGNHQPLPLLAWAAVLAAAMHWVLH